MVKDHLGNKYETIEEMCTHYGITKELWCSRKNYGWSLEHILTAKVGANYIKCYDHLGNEFPTLTAMREHYGITKELWRKRKKRGWTLEKILTTKVRKNGIKCCDHLGNKYETIKEMREHYGITKDLWKHRRKSGWSLEEILTTPKLVDGSKIKRRSITYVCPKGNCFETIQDMCNHYGITIKSYEHGKARGYSLEEILGVIPKFHTKTKDIMIDDHLTIIKHIDEGWYICVKDGLDDIMSHDEIVEYYRKNILKTIA
mgnify:CR=1 FL=1